MGGTGSIKLSVFLIYSNLRKRKTQKAGMIGINLKITTVFYSEIYHPGMITKLRRLSTTQ